MAEALAVEPESGRQSPPDLFEPRPVAVTLSQWRLLAAAERAPAAVPGGNGQAADAMERGELVPQDSPSAAAPATPSRAAEPPALQSQRSEVVAEVVLSPSASTRAVASHAPEPPTSMSMPIGMVDAAYAPCAPLPLSAMQQRASPPPSPPRSVQRSVGVHSAPSSALPNMRMRAAMMSSPDGFLADHGLSSEAAAESRAHVPLLTRAQPTWTLGKSEMLARIADSAQSNAWMHDHASRKLRSWAAWLMVPVIVITTFTGAATATLGTLFSGTSDPRVQTAVSMALGLLGLFAAILGTLEQKFGFAKQSERHARTSLDWWDMHATTATCLALPFDERPPFNLFAEQVLAQLDAIRRSRPRLPNASIAAYRARFGGVLQHPHEVGALAPTMPTPYAADHELQAYLEEAGGIAGPERLHDLRRRFMEAFRGAPEHLPHPHA